MATQRVGEQPVRRARSFELEDVRADFGDIRGVIAVSFDFARCARSAQDDKGAPEFILTERSESKGSG
jgi:hypothetical protein